MQPDGFAKLFVCAPSRRRFSMLAHLNLYSIALTLPQINMEAHGGPYMVDSILILHFHVDLEERACTHWLSYFFRYRLPPDKQNCRRSRSILIPAFFSIYSMRRAHLIRPHKNMHRYLKELLFGRFVIGFGQFFSISFGSR